MTSVRSTSCTDARIVVVRSIATPQIDAGGQQRAKPRQLGADAIDGVDHVRARLGGHDHRHRRLAVDAVRRSRTSWTLSVTAPRSASRTTAPLLAATISGR